jgi:hypothetical protein
MVYPDFWEFFTSLILASIRVQESTIRPFPDELSEQAKTIKRRLFSSPRSLRLPDGKELKGRNFPQVIKEQEKLKKCRKHKKPSAIG